MIDLQSNTYEMLRKLPGDPSGKIFIALHRRTLKEYIVKAQERYASEIKKEYKYINS